MLADIRRVLVFLFIGLIACLRLCGQQVLSNQPEQDCFGAIPICYTIYNTTASYSGSGNISNEINPNFSCLSSGEKNDVWYMFRTHSAGYISFTITPVNPHDDYDWAVFNITLSSCANIFSDPTMEVSCNYDANIGCNGVTGANGMQGPCGQTEPVIYVQAGEIYLINISNYSSSQSGYTIDFSESTATIFDNTPPRALDDTLFCTQNSFNVVFNEPIACSSLSFSGSEFALADTAGNKIFPQSITYVGCDSLHPFITQARLFFGEPPANSTVYYLLAVKGSDHNTLSDLCGNFVAENDTLATFHILNNLSVNLGSDITVCPADDLPLLFSPPTQALHFSWYKNHELLNTNSYYQPNDTGTYVLFVYSGTVCFARDTVMLNYSPSLQVHISGNRPVCEKEVLPQLEAVVSDSLASVTWYANGLPVAFNNVFYQPADTGMVMAKVTASGVCSSSDSVKVARSSAEKPVLTSSALCRGSTTTIKAAWPGSGQILWIFNGDSLATQDSILTTSHEGIYCLVYTNAQGCSSADSITLSTTDTPVQPQLECPQFNINGNVFSWLPVEADTLWISKDMGNTFVSLPGNTTSYTTEVAIHSIFLAAANSSCRTAAVQSPPCEAYITQLLSPSASDHYFTISGLETPISLMVYDSQGKQVFSKVNYQNDWFAPNLRQGIYFYTIKAGKAHYLSGKFLLLK